MRMNQDKDKEKSLCYQEDDNHSEKFLLQKGEFVPVTEELMKNKQVIIYPEFIDEDEDTD